MIIAEYVARVRGLTPDHHLKLVHPAARGAIRRKDRYAAHVRSVLGAVPK